MSALTFITDETHKRRYAQIDLAEISAIDEEQLEEIMDIIVAEARKDDDRISLNELENQLKTEGLL